MKENITSDELHALADKCTSLASLLRDSRRNLPSWQMITKLKVNELVNQFHELELITYDDSI